MRRTLFGFDILAVTVALAAVSLTGDPAEIGPGGALLVLAAVPLWALLAKVYGLYDRDEERAQHTTVDDLPAILHVCAIGSLLFFSAAQVFGVGDRAVPTALALCGLAALLMAIGRSIARGLLTRQLATLQNAVVVGAGDVGQLVVSKLLKHPEYGMNVVGFMDAEPREPHPDLAHVALLGPPERLPEIVEGFDVERVIIAFSNDSPNDVLALMRSIKHMDIQIDIVPRLFDMLGPSMGVHTVEGLPLLSLPPLRLSRTALAVKRAVDIAVSTLALVACAPLLALIAFAIRRDSRGGAIYKHARLGREGRTVKVFKFRTMRSEYCVGSDYGGGEAEAALAALLADPRRGEEFARSHKLTDDPRVTRVGRFLRRTSLDELPQLINVLRGELSLVGPRPITADELERYGVHADMLLDVKPGLTGYWQINGRSSTTYADRVRLDIAYVTGWSLKLDFVILAKTARVLLGSREAA